MCQPDGTSMVVENYLLRTIELWILTGLLPRDSFESLSLYPNASHIDPKRCPIILVDEGGVFGRFGIVAKPLG
jgi:hypothetical protein